MSEQDRQSSRFSRREFLQKAGQIGAMSLMTPLLSSGRIFAQGANTVRVGSMPVLDTSQLWLGLHHGFYAKHGLNVSYQNMAGGAVIAPAVEGGSMDIGWSNAVSIFIANERGFDFEFLMPGAYEVKETGNIVHKIMTAPDSGITSPSQLEGKTFAVNTLGNISELAAKSRLAYWGVDPKNVRYVEVGYPDIVPAVMRKSVDAALVIEPFVTIGEQQGARVLDPQGMGSIGDRFMIAGWFAKRSWVQRNRQLAQDFVDASMEATRFYLNNPEEIYPAIAEYTAVDLELAKQVKIPGFASELDINDLRVVIARSYEYGFIKRPFDAREVISELSPMAG